MSRLLRIAPGEFYHLYNRGVEKRNIFRSRFDYERFTALLYLGNQDQATDLKRQGRSFSEIADVRTGTPLVDIVAYCLMPNHFHLLVREREEGGVGKFMQKLTTGYTMYVNKHYQRSGALFEGTYKAKHAGDERYLRYLISYIHLNPVKLIDSKWKEEGIKNRLQAERYLENYAHSSYLDYLGIERPQAKLLERKTGVEFFESAGDAKKCIAEWLSYNNDKVGQG